MFCMHQCGKYAKNDKNLTIFKNRRGLRFTGWKYTMESDKVARCLKICNFGREIGDFGAKYMAIMHKIRGVISTVICAIYTTKMTVL